MNKRLTKALQFFSAIILITVSLSLFSYAVSYVAKGGKRLGVLSEPINQFASFPKTVMTVLSSSELKGVPPTYIEKDDSFQEINNLKYNLYGLNSFYNRDKELWEVKLFNFKNDSVVHQWNLSRDIFTKGERNYENAEPQNCIILPDSSLIADFNQTNNLFKLDKASNIIWKNSDKLFHHSLNIDNDGNIWTGSTTSRGVKDYRKKVRLYRDDCITKVNGETGEIIFDKSVSGILIENGYKSVVYGFSNYTGFTDYDMDPIHLNDVEPVKNDSPYWKEGDVFVSLRNKSLVFLYRPETNQIIHMLYGPFLNQHDVDIISDKEISIFNNNVTEVGVISEVEIIENEHGAVKEIDQAFVNSEIIIYNFEDGTYRTHLQHQFEKERIFTKTEGLHEHLSTGDLFVESQNNGKLYIINDDEVVLRKFFHTSIDNMVETPNWIRIYENLNF